MKLLLIDNADSERSDYNKPLASALSRFIKSDVLPYEKVTLDTVKQYDAVVLSGVPIGYSFSTIKERRQRYEWLLDIEVPVLGVCLGHQVIGTVFGAKVKRTESEAGPTEIRVLMDDPIFEGMADTLPVEAHHRASITLPAGFRQLASSAVCSNQIMKHAIKPIYGLQFHPEYNELGQSLLANFVALAKPSVIIAKLAAPAFGAPDIAPDALVAA